MQCHVEGQGFFLWKYRPYPIVPSLILGSLSKTEEVGWLLMVKMMQLVAGGQLHGRSNHIFPGSGMEW